MSNYITLREAKTTYDNIVKVYVAPKFNGVELIKMPTIDMEEVFGNRKRMEVEKLTAEICQMVSKFIDQQ